MNNKYAETIKGELRLLSDLINYRFKIIFDNHNGGLDSYESFYKRPCLGSDNEYVSLIKKHSFGFEERMLIALAMTPNIQPELLDAFFTKNPNLDKPFTEFGGVKGSKIGGFIPTIETFLFLCAGRNHSLRLKMMQLFERDHVLSSEGIININREENNEPFGNSLISIKKDYLSLLTKGQRTLPEFSINFPARLLETPLEWNDLVLDHSTLNQINEIIVWVNNKDKLMNEWGLSPGYKSLFYGSPGTGKTLTAALIGKKCNQSVLRVDLSLIISKFIGETEKNLSNIIDTAKNRNWILFFDEADALFGKRTNLNSANDRFANQQVFYLLQRIESFSGVVLLASNIKSKIDDAFMRRFQSIVRFPKPGAKERLSLWENAFSKHFSVASDISFSEIARNYEVTGGNIRNIVQYCSLQLLMHKKDQVELKDVISGIKRELSKEGQIIN